MEHSAIGSCLCGAVTYQMTGHLGIFQYCHCSRCRKFTGSAHAANIMVSVEQFEWLQGESLVGRYEPAETKYLTTAFCKVCGSSLPWQSKNARVVIVPAGTLDEDPEIRPMQNIFCDSDAVWYVEASELTKFAELPKKRD